MENVYHIFKEVIGEFGENSSPFCVPKQKDLYKNSLQNSAVIIISAIWYMNCLFTLRSHHQDFINP